jgi:serine/threonine-protein kinase
VPDDKPSANANVPDRDLQLVIGGYRLMRHMWTGQESQVWEVSEVASRRHFAMKILLPEKITDDEARRNLYHEADVGRQLAHPNIIKIISLKKEKANPHFVMEFFPSGSLKMRIMRMADHREFIRDKCFDILKHVATALAFMHSKGYVHRDVKPENVLVSGIGEVRLIDFALTQKIPSGMARWFYMKPHVASGTRSYMSPEQIRREPLDGRSDMYAFACTAYELVTGRPPFRGKDQKELLTKHLREKPLSPATHNPDITDEFADFILRLLAKKREERPENFHQVLMALRGMRIFKTGDLERRESKPQ